MCVEFPYESTIDDLNRLSFYFILINFHPLHIELNHLLDLLAVQDVELVLMIFCQHLWTKLSSYLKTNTNFVFIIFTK
jgi:hypothetical protein